MFFYLFFDLCMFHLVLTLWSHCDIGNHTSFMVRSNTTHFLIGKLFLANKSYLQLGSNRVKFN